MQATSTSRPFDTTRRLFDLAWPIVGVNVLQVLALAIDTAMVGRTPNADVALTGMGYASQLAFLLMVAMFGLVVGAVSFISRAHGVGDDQRCGHLLQQSTQITIALGLAVTVVGNLLAVPLLHFLGADEATMQPALDYFRPLLFGTAFNYLNILFAAALRGIGNTRLAFFVALGLNVLNTILNYGLILGNWGLPAWGNFGAAIGTVIAQACAAILMAVLLHQRVVPGIFLKFRYERVDRALTLDLFRVGWPAAADVLVLNAGLISIVGMLGRIDQAAVAAHSIGIRIQALAFVPGVGVSQAVGAMVGQALGAGDLPAAKRVLRAGIALSALIMSILGLLFIFADHAIVELFGIQQSSPIHAFSIEWLELLGYSMPIFGYVIAVSGLFQGAGATMTSLRINAVTTILAQIPGSYVLGFVFGLGAWGVWAMFPITFVLKAVWAQLEYRREKWAVLGQTV